MAALFKHFSTLCTPCPSAAPQPPTSTYRRHEGYPLHSHIAKNDSFTEPDHRRARYLTLISAHFSPCFVMECTRRTMCTQSQRPHNLMPTWPYQRPSHLPTPTRPCLRPPGHVYARLIIPTPTHRPPAVCQRPLMDGSGYQSHMVLVNHVRLFSHPLRINGHQNISNSLPSP